MRTQLSQEDETRRKSGGNYTTALSNWKHSKVKKKKKNIKISRLARGIPVGSSLEFIDEVTLTHSLNDRVEVK